MCGVGSQGYICTGSSMPDFSLNCSSGTPGNDQSMQYCCSGGTVDMGDAGTGGDAGGGGICTPTMIAACTGGSMGYTCTGSNPPFVGTPGLNCGNGTPAGSTTLYCCTSPAPTLEAGTCATAPAGSATCTGGAVAYACAGGVSPSTATPSLSCGAGTPWEGEMLFCCSTGGSSEAGASCKVGVSSGSAACDTCVDNACCNQLTACDTPDDAGTDSSGQSACERLIGCLLDCMVGNPDAGVDAGSPAECQTLCNPSYTMSEQQAAQAVMSCEMTSCGSLCQ